MSYPEELKHLNAEITSHIPHLGKCLSYVLSLYVLAMVVMQHCGQSRIATFLNGLMGCPFGIMKQLLREFTYESECKQGEKPQAVEIKTYFAPLLAGSYPNSFHRNCLCYDYLLYSKSRSKNHAFNHSRKPS